MTETKIRLPEVGKRYQHKRGTALSQVVSYVDREDVEVRMVKFESGGRCQLSIFFDFWELPPLSKTETTEKQQSIQDGLTAQQWKLVGRDYFSSSEYARKKQDELKEKISVTFQKADQPKIGFNSGTWSDVEPSIKDKALEELKKEIESVLSRNVQASNYGMLIRCAQNLVNALEEEKRQKSMNDSTIPETTEKGSDNLSPSLELSSVDKALEKLEEEIKYEGLINVECYYRLKTAARNVVNALEEEKKEGKKSCEYISFIKQLTKKESEELEQKNKAYFKEFPMFPAKTIWKDVGELPEDFFERCFIKRRSGEIALELLKGSEAYDNYDNKSFEPIKYCTLTDFINSFESEKQAREQLEERVKLLEKKNG